MEVVNALGRRKAAVARVFVCEGSGVVTINKKRVGCLFPLFNTSIHCKATA